MAQKHEDDVQLMLLGGVPLIGSLPMSRPNLNTPVGHAPLPWTDIPETTAIGTDFRRAETTDA